MTRDDIFRMAREAGWNGIYTKPLLSISLLEENFLHFAALVAAVEREECARIAETAEPYRSADLIRARSCPPCNNNCNQGRACPARNYGNV